MMKSFFNIIVGLMLLGCVSAAPALTSIKSLKEVVSVKELVDQDFNINPVVRVRSPTQRQANWVNAVAARGGQINIFQGADLLEPASRITAILTPTMRGTGKKPNVKVPNFAQFQSDFNGAGARCHIIGAQLGGAGNVQANLFPCFQGNFNTPVMRNFENSVAAELGNGNTVEYSVELNYGANYYPDSVEMEASIQATGQRLFHVKIDNTPAAPVTNLP